MIAATLADILLPVYAGRLVDAVANSADDRDAALGAALRAFGAIVVLGLAMLVLRTTSILCVVGLTLRMMSVAARDAFWRVQRFSTDWHANSFAGSTVRKVTRGMWAIDSINDTLLLALLSSGVVLIGSALLLGLRWPLMGLVVAVGAFAYIGLTVALSLGWVAPASRLSNSWDT